MKLLKLHISRYKNLKEVEIDFSNSDGCALIIGTNGTGKSNLLEVFSAIFSACYNKDKNVKPDFRFELEYVIETMRTIDYGRGSFHGLPINVKIRNVDGVIEIWHAQRGAEYEILEKSQWDIVLPEHTIAVYSGEEKRLWEEYYFSHYDNYNRQYMSGKPYADQRMLYINKYYWDLIAAVMAVSNDEGEQQFLADLLGGNITFIHCEFDINNIRKNKNAMAKEILDYINPMQEKELDLPIEKFKNAIEICGYEQELFLNFIVLVLYKKYKIITNFKVVTSTGISIKNLSEGEKKLLLIYGAISILYGENLLLFDEPDAYLHEARKKEIIDLILGGWESQFVITSHSPKLIKSLPYGSQIILRQNGEEIEAVTASGFSVLAPIIDSDITFEEEFAIKESRKPLLLVEGKTDKKHLTIAWSKLYPNKEMPFYIISLAGTDKVRQFIKSVPDVFAKSTIIGLVDNDGAGQKVKEGCQEIKENIYKFKNDQNQARQAYCILIPFVDDKVKIFNYCPIEFLYNIDILLANDAIEKSNYRVAMPKWIQSGMKSIDEESYETYKELCFYKVKESAKNSFSDKVSGLHEDAFSNFVKIFDIIESVLKLCK